MMEIHPRVDRQVEPSGSVRSGWGNRFLAVAFWPMVGMMMLSGLAMAAEITVTTTDDSQIEDGQCSLREAIINANNANQSGSSDCTPGDAGGNTIVFDAGLAWQTIVLDGEELLIATRSLSIEGPVPGDASGLILDGDQLSRIFRITGPGQHVAVNLRGLTLTGGRTESLADHGGGLRAQNVSLTLEHVAVIDNSTGGNSSEGGGIFGSYTHIELIDSLVEGNHVEGLQTRGGGIFVQASNLKLVRTRVIDNRTEGAGASNGAGIWAGYHSTNGSDLSLTDSVVAGNHTENGTTFGGGIWAAGGEVIIIGSTVSGNSVAHGGAGGIHLNETQFILLNSTVSANSSTAAGGGMQIRSSTASLSHSTVAFNWSGSTRDISVWGTADVPSSVALINSMVVQEDASRATCSSNDHATITAFGSLSTHDSCTGTATMPGDIRLMPLADNGGGTHTHALGPSSVAVDAAGDCVAAHGVIVDQRGESRPGGDSAACDVGAYEQQEVPPEADLHIELAVSPEQAEAGETAVFHVELVNLGPDAADNASVQVQLPDGYQFVSATPNLGSYESATGVWTIGHLANSVVMSMNLEVTLNAEGDRLAAVSASSDAYDPDPSNNVDQAEVALVVPPPQGAMVVDTLADVIAEDGFCSLREAITNARNGDQSGSVDCVVGNLIRFDPSLTGGVIELNGGQLPALTVDLVIEGPTAGDPAGITLDAQGNSRHFNIEGDIIVQMQDMTLIGGQVSGTAISGGALRIFNGPEVTMRRMRFEGNTSVDAGGGAIQLHTGSLTLIDSELSGNQAPSEVGRGGGVVVTDGTLVLEGTTIAGNFAGSQGGGIELSTSELNLINSTLSGNTSGGDGGGIRLYGSSATLIHGTVAFNTASGGGSGIYVHATSSNPVELSLLNSLAVENHCHANGGNHYTLVSSGSLSTASGCVEGAATPVGEINLLALADNGGPTRTHALGSDSVAIGFAGDCVVDFGIDGDQRGQPRPGDSSTACDSGAYEFQGNNANAIFNDRFEGAGP